MSVMRSLLIALVLSCCASAWCADIPPPKPQEDLSAEIVKCDANSCQVSDRLIGSMAGLPGCLIDLSSGDGQRMVRQVDNFRKPGAHLQPSGEAKVMYHNWLDQTQAKGASILGFLKGNLEKNDRLEVKSTMLPGVSVLPEDLDYAKIAAVFKGMPRSEVDKYGIVMGVMVYEVSGAIYNASNRKLDVDWPCFSLAGGKSLLYKAGEENSKCLLLAVYAPVPFCIDLDTLSRTPPDQTKSGHLSSLSVDAGVEDARPDYSQVTKSGAAITKLLGMYMSSHKPKISIANTPRAVGVNVPK